MKVLVLGSGGREHALCWKLAQSNRVSKIYCAPGNGGIGEIAENVDILPEDIDGLVDFAKKKNIGLTLVGPEGPLVLGIVDRFKKEG
ncbi:MAG: phosphoribosylamine--glycine ligase, partial [Tissierellia bacterium]|nr:phosphoribosylamine--glycine ligase [Tissierellia bacterium]